MSRCVSLGVHVSGRVGMLGGTTPSGEGAGWLGVGGGGRGSGGNAGVGAGGAAEWSVVFVVCGW